jgi:hypothetical protein
MTRFHTLFQRPNLQAKRAISPTPQGKMRRAPPNHPETYQQF